MKYELGQAKQGIQWSATPRWRMWGFALDAPRKSENGYAMGVYLVTPLGRFSLVVPYLRNRIENV